MKKILSCIVILAMTTLCSCGDPNYVSEEQYLKNQNKTIIKCIKEKDSVMLKSILCPYMQNKEDIDEKIESLLKFIDGNIVSYDESEGSRDSASYEPEGAILKKLSGSTSNIVTDTGKKYDLHFSLNYVYKDLEEYVGVYMINIGEVDRYTNESNVIYKNSCIIFLNDYLNK